MAVFLRQVTKLTKLGFLLPKLLSEFICSTADLCRVP